MSKHTHQLLGSYEVYPNGTILSRSGWRGKELRPLSTAKDEDGYHCVRLVLNGKRKKWRLHRLIAELFLGPRPSPQYEVRHLDDDKDNNCVSNLLWGTRKDNVDDRERNGKTSRGAPHKEAIRAGIERARVDARLIAAAPELLSSLKSLLAMIDEAPFELSHEEELFRVTAHAVITKAEGREI